MKAVEVFSLSLGLIASIITILFCIFPEASSIIALDIRSRIAIASVLFLSAFAPILYDRKLRPRKIDENYPFDPLQYYHEETDLIRNDLPCIGVFENIDGLTEDDVENRFVVPQDFVLPQEFQAKAQSKWKKIESRLKKEGREIGTYPTARLFDLKWNKKRRKLILYFQKAQYWQAHVTNFNLDWKGFSEHMRDLIAPGPRLKPLSQSEFTANHLGLNCIILTRDGNIFLQERSMREAVGAGQIGPSAAGRMKWEDRTSGNAPPSPFIGIFNQMHEELGITRDDIEDIKLVAICRELPLGGKPTAIFVVRTMLSWNEVEDCFERKPESSWETDQLLPLSGNDRKEIEKMFNRDNIGLPTKVCLYYYMKHVGL